LFHNREFFGASRELKAAEQGNHATSCGHLLPNVVLSCARNAMNLLPSVDFAAPIEITIDFGFVLPSPNSACELAQFYTRPDDLGVTLFAVDAVPFSLAG